MDEEKKISKEITFPEKPKRKRNPARRSAGKKSEVLEEFLKKQNAPVAAAPVEALRQAQDKQVPDEEEIVDKLETKSARLAEAVVKRDAYAGEGKSARQKKILKISLITLVSLLLLGLLGSAGYFYFQYKKAVEKKPEVVQDESLELAEKVGKLMVLPPGEKPTIATVTDKDKVSQQPFFAYAENGDKALIYTEAKKAILYRPSINRLIEVMPLSEAKKDEPAQAGQPAPTDVPQEAGQPETAPPPENQSAESQPQAARVAVYNGARINGLAQKIADSLSQMTGIEITEKTNAQSKYKKTTVIDLSGSRGELIQKIAETLGGEVATMPEGELKPEADILIIGGSDFKIE